MPFYVLVYCALLDANSLNMFLGLVHMLAVGQEVAFISLNDATAVKAFMVAFLPFSCFDFAKYGERYRDQCPMCSSGAAAISMQ